MSNRRKEGSFLEDDPLWYKDAVIYELHVRSFFDSNGDGVGDFSGLTEKLDYLQDLGVTALWLLPFYPSPLKDDGYDIADYTSIHPDYGTLADFATFLREAHRRGLRVINELVLNHTSDQHLWFQRARRAPPRSRWRDFYVWSDGPDRYEEARIIFKDFESSNWTWDPIAKAYYWHRFYSHQPDLNYDNPQVRRAILQVVDFWLKMGVDGLRLDAVPYLYEREGTSCENLPETHGFLKALRHHTDQGFSQRMLLAEANQWPDDATAYFGDGDECHMAFHFPLMPRLFMSLYLEDRFPIIDILEQTPSIAPSCQWALFLRNHDELTLEMVTDEERDYMYRVYAQDPHARINLGIRRRLAPLMGNNRRRIELLKALLFSLPGTPVLYYGDEIGMGDNIYLGDRNGVRTPMQWSADRNAGFSRANPQRLYLPVIIDPEYHYEAVNEEAQHNNPHSLLWWTKRLLNLRKRFRAFGRGSLEFLYPRNHKVLAFLRRYQDQSILVVANLSRFVQGVELDLSALRGMEPVELFGQTRFPPIGEAPYFLTLGPHAFYWFSVTPQPAEVQTAPPATEGDLPAIRATGTWQSAIRGNARANLEAILPSYLKARRWFGGKGRIVHSAKIVDTLPVAPGPEAADGQIALLRVEYTEGAPEIYALPIAFAPGERAERVLKESPQAAIARIQMRGEGERGLLYDALWDKAFCQTMLEAILRRKRYRGGSGELVAWPARARRRARESDGQLLEPSILRTEQSNTSVVYGDRFILKLFRRIEEGVNPDLEVGRFLTEKKGFTVAPPLAGAIEYRQRQKAPQTLAVLHSFIPNQGDAWQYTLDALGLYAEWALTQPEEEAQKVTPLLQGHLLDLAEADIPDRAYELIGPYLQSAELLGQRTAELHLAFASDAEDSNFAPEPFNAFYQRSLWQSMRRPAVSAFQLLRSHLKDLPETVREEARQVLEREEEVFKRFLPIRQRKIAAMRIRCHGDYHLGQVLYTGKDFKIIDFEGEPARSWSERRIKRSPLRDVAGMLRSFHYASCFALLGQITNVGAHHQGTLQPWIRFWQLWVSAAFLKAYLGEAGHAQFMPKVQEDVQVLLDAYLLEKAVYEVAYELNNRPDWVRIPLWGILQLLESEGSPP